MVGDFIYHMTALDEFGRLYNNLQVCPSRFESFEFQKMVYQILEKMGTDARAIWICDKESFDDWMETNESMSLD